MSLRSPLLSCLMATIVPTSAQPGHRPSKVAHPIRSNIILFMADDLGWQDTSVPFWTERTPLNDRYETPDMARLAHEGMLFTQAYAAPISSPTKPRKKNFTISHKTYLNSTTWSMNTSSE